MVARETELREVEALLATADVRAVTLTGPLGVGRRELAAAALARWNGAVKRVDLSRCRSGALSIARALGLPQTGSPLLESLAETTLLVLTEVNPSLAIIEELSELLAACPSLKLLCTSVCRLGLPGEREVALAGLETNAALVLAPALASQAEPLRSQALAALHGNPLALSLLQLALQAQPAPVVLPRLKGAALPGLASLVFDALSERERQAVEALVHFVGGAPQAAARVLGAGPMALQALQGWRLVRIEGDRLVVPGSARELFEQRCARVGAAANGRDAHASWYQSLARDVGFRLERGPEATDLRVLDEELPNLEHALSHFLAQRRHVEGLELAVALSRFFDLRAHWRDGLHWLTAFQPQQPEPRAWGLALNRAGLIAFRLGDFAASEAYHRRALELADPQAQLDAVDRLQWCAVYQGRTAEGAQLAARGWPLAVALGESRRLARAKGQRAWALFEEGKREEAQELYAEAVKELQGCGDKADLAYMLNALGEVHRSRAQYAAAREAYERCLALARDLGAVRQMSVSLYNLAMVARSTGDRRAGLKSLLEAVEISLRIDDRGSTGLHLLAIAHFAALSGKATLGAKLLGSAEAHLKAKKGVVTFADRDDYQTAVSLLRAHLGQGPFDTLRTEGSLLSARAALTLGTEALER